jgi:hypothetical protein
MRTNRSPLLIFISFVLPVALGGGCSPLPANDALGWNGRGMTLPAETGTAGAGAAGDPGRGDAGVGGGGSAGAAGAGSAGSGASQGTGGAAAAGASGSGSTAGASGSGASGSGPGTAGSGGNGGTSPPPPVDGGMPPPVDGGMPPPGNPLSATCHLDVVVTTHSGGGNHAPKNVDAIWMQDAGGTFVKSLYVMARNEIQHLNAWNAATTAAGLSRNRVDAVTGASLSGYGTRMASWNCTDVNQKLVAAGGYQVCFDLNDGNGTDKHTCDDITLGKIATTVMPPDVLPCFTGRSLTYTP